jgi:NAD(P)-dependent dehydrogenase (short-subunit alcohol dehydrogenase family)
LSVFLARHVDGGLEGRAEQSGKSLDEIKEEGMAVQSIKQLVDPRDFAALAVFLASDAARIVTGASYEVTGGDSAHLP